jgi:predicted SnoaL-like aldol condensation-catalyzing enzyme
MSRSAKQNAELVEAAVQAVFSEHRIDQIGRYFREDLLQHSPLVPDDGRDALREWVAGTVAAVPDLTYVPSQVLADGDRVLLFATVRGTIHHDLPDFGIKASGQKLEVDTAHLFRLVDDKIAEHWEVVDTGALYRLAAGSQDGG